VKKCAAAGEMSVAKGGGKGGDGGGGSSSSMQHAPWDHVSGDASVPVTVRGI